MAGVVIINNNNRARWYLDGAWVGDAVNLTNSTAFDIDLALSYDSGTSTATLSGMIDGTAVSGSKVVSDPLRMCNAFGTGSAYADGLSNVATTRFDNVQYTANVPDPSALLLLTTGLFGLLAYAWRRGKCVPS